MQTKTTIPAAPDHAPGSIRVAVIGAGLAGASCGRGLRYADAQVTVFERSRHVGGRMATRLATWADDAGIGQSATFDHGAQSFTAVRPRFRAFMARAVAEGRAVRWQPLVHSSRSVASERCFVPTPTTPALCGHLLAEATLHLERTVRRLQRAADGAWYVVSDGAPLAGPFRYVVLAVPPAQAAVLLAGHEDRWAAALMAKRMEACWTLMAVTDDVDWPWDAAEPDRGPLAWVARNDRVPARGAPQGCAVWTAHATAEWSAARLEAEPGAIALELQAALRAQLPIAGSNGRPLRWHHASAHRWSHAGPAFDCDDSFDSGDALWNEALGLGVCGDWLGGGGVEGAWHSGDELADAMAASFERPGAARHAAATLQPHSSSVSSADDHLVTG
ncbi:MAG: NAD(P)-binding protein [Caldimonas sp.]